MAFCKFDMITGDEMRTLYFRQELENLFDEYLDARYGKVVICGEEFDSSFALREIGTSDYYNQFFLWLEGRFVEIEIEDITLRERDYYHVESGHEIYLGVGDVC